MHAKSLQPANMPDPDGAPAAAADSPEVWWAVGEGFIGVRTQLCSPQQHGHLTSICSPANNTQNTRMIPFNTVAGRPGVFMGSADFGSALTQHEQQTLMGRELHPLMAQCRPWRFNMHE
jgi:hypothetical protein